MRTPTRRRRFTLMLLSASLLMIIGATAALSDRSVLRFLTWLVATNSDYELRAEGFTIQWLPLRVSAALLLLNPKDPTAPPLIAVQDVSYRNDLSRMLLGDTIGGALDATNLTLYLDEQKTSERPDTEALLRSLSLLPAALDIGTIHFIEQDAQVWIFPIRGFRGRIADGGGIAVSANAHPVGADLDLDLNLRFESATKLRLDAVVEDPGRDVSLTLSGSAEASPADIRYDLDVDGHYGDVQDFLSALDEAAIALPGRLILAGTLQGGLNDYRFALERLAITSAGSHDLVASGDITAFGQASPTLDLSVDASFLSDGAAGVLPEALSPLIERADTALKVRGNLSDPRVTALNADVTVAGAGSINAALELDLPLLRFPQDLGEHPVKLRAEGGLQTLSRLLAADIPAEVPWTLTADASVAENGWRLSSLRFDARDNPSVENGSFVALRGALRLALENTGDGSAPPSPSDGDAAIEAGKQRVPPTPSGTGTLALRDLELEGDLSLTPGMLPSGWADALTRQGLARASVRGTLRGDIAELAAGRGLDLGLDVLVRPGWSAGVAPALYQHVESLAGAGRITRAAQRWRLQDLRLAVGLDSGAELRASGTLDYGHGAVIGDVALEQMGVAERLHGLPDLPDLISAGATAQLRLSESYATVLAEIDTTTPGAPAPTRAQVVASADLVAGRIDRLSLDLYAPRLDPAVLQLPFNDTRSFANAASAAESEERTFPLPDFPFETTLRVDALDGEATHIDRIAFSAESSGDTLLLRQMDASYGSGELQLRGLLNLGASTPGLSLAGQAFSLPLGTLAQDLGLAPSVRGTLNFRGGIAAEGLPGDGWLETMGGRVAFSLEDAVVQGPAYDLLMSNLLAWIAVGQGERSTRLTCTMMQFDIDAGVARADDLYVETPRMVATGKAQIDLAEQTLDLRLEPRSRSRTVQFPSAVKITGPLNNPKVSVSALQATADASAQALLLIPSLTLKLFGIAPRQDGMGGPCQASLR